LFFFLAPVFEFWRSLLLSAFSSARSTSGNVFDMFGSPPNRSSRLSPTRVTAVRDLFRLRFEVEFLDDSPRVFSEHCQRFLRSAFICRELTSCDVRFCALHDPFGLVCVGPFFAMGPVTVRVLSSCFEFYLRPLLVLNRVFFFCPDSFFPRF